MTPFGMTNGKYRRLIVEHLVRTSFAKVKSEPKYERTDGVYLVTLRFDLERYALEYALSE